MVDDFSMNDNPPKNPASNKCLNRLCSFHVKIDRTDANNKTDWRASVCITRVCRMKNGSNINIAANIKETFLPHIFLIWQ